jgi:hypothetical protein
MELTLGRALCAGYGEILEFSAGQRQVRFQDGGCGLCKERHMGGDSRRRGQVLTSSSLGVLAYLMQVEA